MKAENLPSDMIKQLNEVLLAPDVESQLDRFMKFLPALGNGEEIEPQKFNLLNQLEFHRDMAIAHNNQLKEVIAYLLMLKLSSKLNLFEVEEKLHSNFELHVTLQHENLEKLIGKLENKEWRDKLNSQFDEIEKSIVRISTSIANGASAPTTAAALPRGSAMGATAGSASDKNIDEALLAKINEYKRIVRQDEIKPQAAAEENTATAAPASKLSEFFALSTPEKLWFIAEEALRRTGLTGDKRRSILPYELKLNDPDLLEGVYSDNYIAAESGLWKISQRLLSKINAEKPEEIAALFEHEVDHIIGQVALCWKNRFIYGLVERNRDFMPIYNDADQIMLNTGNIMFNEAIAAKGSLDDMTKFVQLALQTIGEYGENNSKIKKFFYTITRSKISLPTQMAVTPRNPIMLREDEFSYFVL